MKVDSIISVAIAEDQYDVTLRTNSGNYAIAHCDQFFVIQSVSRVEKQPDNTFKIVDQYSVIPQECRVAVSKIKNDSNVLNALLMNGVWNNPNVANA